MTRSFAGVLAAAWRLFRRDRDLVLRVVGPLVFFPAFAAQLLCDPVPGLPAEPRDPVAMQAWMDAVVAWGQGNALGYFLSDLIGIYGLAVLAILLAAPSRPTVGEAMRGAGQRLLSFALLSLLVAIPVGLGLWLFVLPGLYAQARFAAAIPALAAAPGEGMGAAITRSLQRTRGWGLPLTGAIVTLFLAQWVVAVPLLSADEWVRQPANLNPPVLALIDAGLAAAATVFHLGVLLIGVVAYRASKGT
jgi:hypothetical protein